MKKSKTQTLIWAPWYKVAVDPALQPPELREGDSDRNYRSYLASYLDEGHRVSEPLKVSTGGLKGARHPASDYEPRGTKRGEPVIVGWEVDGDGALTGKTETRPWNDYRLYVAQYMGEEIEHRAIFGYGRMEALPVLAYAYYVKYGTTLMLPCVDVGDLSPTDEAAAVCAENERLGTVRPTVRDRLVRACRFTDPKGAHKITREVDFVRAIGLPRNSAQRYFLAGLLNNRFGYVDRLTLPETDDQFLKCSTIAGVTPLNGLLGKSKPENLDSGVKEACKMAAYDYTQGQPVPRSVFDAWTLATQTDKGGKSKGALTRKELEELESMLDAAAGELASLLAAIKSKDLKGAKVALSALL